MLMYGASARLTIQGDGFANQFDYLSGVAPV